MSENEMVTADNNAPSEEAYETHELTKEENEEMMEQEGEGKGDTHDEDADED